MGFLDQILGSEIREYHKDGSTTDRTENSSVTRNSGGEIIERVERVHPGIFEKIFRGSVDRADTFDGDGNKINSQVLNTPDVEKTDSASDLDDGDIEPNSSDNLSSPVTTRNVNSRTEIRHTAEQDQLDKLAMDRKIESRRTAASHTKTRPSTLARMFEIESDAECKELILKNPSTPVALLESYQYRCRANKKFRKSLALNPSTSACFLRSLSLDNDYETRLAVASNPASDEQTLLNVTRLADPATCRAIIQNPSATTRVLDNLSLREEPELRALVAKDSRTSSGIVRFLFDDPNFEVINALLKRFSDNPQVWLKLHARRVNLR